MSPREGYRLLVAEIENARRLLGLPSGGSPPCPACSDCCRTFAVLPIEADVLPEPPVLSLDARGTGNGHGGAGRREDADGNALGDGCCPYLSDGGCIAGDERPVACRMRGIPAPRLTADGDWILQACPRQGAAFAGVPAAAKGPAADTAAWIARLWRLNEEYCRGSGASSRRIALGDRAGRRVSSGAPLR